MYLKIGVGKLYVIVQLEKWLKAECQQTNRTIYLPKYNVQTSRVVPLSIKIMEMRNCILDMMYNCLLKRERMKKEFWGICLTYYVSTYISILNGTFN